MSPRPLVTFAVVTYNQRDFVLSAIQGAFSQSYSPLEIIISDDHSTDGTYAVAQEYVSRYSGPHLVRIRRNEQNLGVLQHVQAVAAEANGSIIVLAAGDDISMSDRVDRLLAAYQDDTYAAFSNYTLINESGEVLRSNRSPASNASERLPWFKSLCQPLFVYGSTSSYRAELLRALPHTLLRVMSEDTPLNTLIQCQNRKVAYVPEPLVQYRQHPRTISRNPLVGGDFETIRQFDEEDQRLAEMNINILHYVREIVAHQATVEAMIDFRYIDQRIEFLSLKSRWSKMNLARRLAALFKCTDKDVALWCAARLMGSGQLAATKVALRRWMKNEPVTK